MTDSLKLKKKLDARMGKQFEKRPVSIGGFTGNYQGTVSVPGRPGYIYVRDWSGITHIVFNDVAPTDHPGEYVRIGYDKYNPTILRVLGMANPYVDATTGQIGSHHKTHEWPGQDTVWIQSQQIVPALVIKNTGMTVSVYPFWAKMSDNTFIFIPAQDIDLTSYIPTSGACWALISFNTAGTVEVTDDTTAANLATLATTPINGNPDATKISIAAVALFAGQTSIVQTANQNQIVDLRWFGSPGASGDMFKAVYDANDDGVVDDSESTQALQGKAIDPTLAPTDTQVLTWNNTANQWEAADAATGTGDMSKATYDTNDDGVVDDSESTRALRGLAIDPAITPADTQVLAWNDGASQWVAADPGGVTLFDDAEGDPADVATAAADGVSTFTARRDHVHRGSSVVANETPGGLVNGANVDYTTANAFVAGTLNVYLNGQRLKSGGTDFTEGSSAFTMTIAPASGDVLVIDYVRSNGFTPGDADTLDGQHATAFAPASLKDGWTDDSNTWTYSSADSPTFVISINADVTGTIGVGDRIKLTQTVVKYFIVTAVGSYSGGATLVTVYGGTDYTLTNAAISSPAYSHAKTPFGFPATPVKWTTTFTDTTQRTQSSPSATVWYNLGSVSFAIPLGVWRLSYSVLAAGVYNTGGQISVFVTLSTANNTESDATRTRKLNMNGGLTQVEGSLEAEFWITLASKTTLYVNTKSNQAITTLYNQNAQQTLTVECVCGYL